MKVEQKCGIISRTVLNDAAISLTLEVGDMVRTAFRAPGQFVHIKCGHSRLLRRPISVCACQAGEGDEQLRLEQDAVERRENGKPGTVQVGSSQYDVIRYGEGEALQGYVLQSEEGAG